MNNTSKAVISRKGSRYYVTYLAPGGMLPHIRAFKGLVQAQQFATWLNDRLNGKVYYNA